MPTSHATAPDNGDAPEGAKPAPPTPDEAAARAVEILRRVVANYPKGEVRDGQVAMTEAVARAFAGQKNAAIEAPTGTGKSLSYLIPAALHAKALRDGQDAGRIVVATATKTLQQQLIDDDLPDVAKEIPGLRYALLKGRSNFACFSGDTHIITRDGVKPIASLAGQTVTVLDGDGKWVEAPIEHFGTQPLMKVELIRGRGTKTVYATPEHRWIVQPHSKERSSRFDRVTSDLQPGDALASVTPRRSSGRGGVLHMSPNGIQAGIVYGDGTVNSHSANVVLHGHKDAELLKWFPNHPVTTDRLSADHADEFASRVHALPKAYKQLPDLDEAPSYLYGWLAGYFAADGTVDAEGSCRLSSADRAALEHAQAVCLRLGIVTGGIAGRERVGKGKRPSKLYALCIERHMLAPEFFLISHHRARASVSTDPQTRAKHDKRAKARRYWRVKSVEQTGRVEDVYCAVVPTTHSFALEDYILTGNCHLSVSKLDGQEALFSTQVDEGAWNSLRLWLEDTETGDQAEVPDGVTPEMWGKVSVGPRECVGRTKCSFGDVCFAEKARDKANSADIVVTNLHMLMLDATSDAAVLPWYQGAVVDEAHKLPEIAGSIVGVTIRHGRAGWLGDLGQRYVEDKTIERLKAADDRLLAAMQDHVDAGRVDPTKGELAQAIAGLGSAASKAESEARKSKPPKDDETAKSLHEQFLTAAKGMQEDLDKVRAADDSVVVWVEGGGRRKPTLRLAPIEVASKLADGLFDNVPTVLSSATLTVGGLFGHYAAESGLDDAERDWDGLVVPSPFDHATQGLLYVPKHFPNPNNAEWDQLARDATLEMLNAAEGRALLLFTSWRRLNETAEWLDGRIPWTLMRQGDAPPHRLIQRMRDDENSVLCATASFWEGVSIEGSALSLVVVDKLPFGRRDDPMLEALRERAEKAGRSSFGDVDLPRTAKMLAQGVGRLIRTTDDFGVVAVLDSRLATKTYRNVLLGSLPPLARTVNLSNPDGGLRGGPGVVEFLRDRVASTPAARRKSLRVVS